jgi:hypothetical protein
MPRKLRRDADYVLASLPPEGRERYGKALDTYVRTLAAHAHNGTPPEVVAAAVVHALTSPRPRIRYPAGAPARRMLLLRRLLPDRALDRRILHFFQLQQKPSDEGPPARPGHGSTNSAVAGSG